MTTPPEFEEEFKNWYLLMKQSYAKKAADGDVPHIRMVIREFEHLYKEWKPRLEDPDELRALEGARAQVNDHLVKSLEIRWLVHLLELVMARAAAARAPRQLREIAEALEVIAKAPADVREQEERELGEKIDLEADYRESEAGVDRAEEHYCAQRKRMAGLWPERLDRECDRAPRKAGRRRRAKVEGGDRREADRTRLPGAATDPAGGVTARPPLPPAFFRRVGSRQGLSVRRRF